jgi:hypothetical protein
MRGFAADGARRAPLERLYADLELSGREDFEPPTFRSRTAPIRFRAPASPASQLPEPGRGHRRLSPSTPRYAIQVTGLRCFMVADHLQLWLPRLTWYQSARHTFASHWVNNACPPY